LLAQGCKALVHEAYLRLFAAAAEAMRRILVESARRRRSEKYGGQRQRIDFEAAESPAEPPADDLLALDEALDLLAAEDPVKAGLVKLRCFAGLSHQDAAGALSISRHRRSLLGLHQVLALLQVVRPRTVGPAPGFRRLSGEGTWVTG
jgi:hypothetical protein